MIDLPKFRALRITQRSGRVRREDFDAADHVLIVIPTSFRGKLPPLPARALVARLQPRARKHPDKRATARLDNARASGLTLALCSPASTAFERLTWARKTVAYCQGQDGGKLAVLVAGLDDDTRRLLAEALLAAAQAAAFRMPHFKSKDDVSARLKSVTVLAAEPRLRLAALEAESMANNIARWFTTLPPNKLGAAAYRAMLGELAGQHGLEQTFLSEEDLAERNAGAFLAVSQGNADRDAGILRLRYAPKGKATGKLALVGKGILFDTGGNNLKPFKSMLDMHMDMQGSAVAAGLIAALARLEVPYRVDAWLAITENRVSARAYKSQDVVTAANGTTIQVIHTDAEGRMVLADTLALAAEERPDLMIDFATLTGTCETALTSAYSGVFTNTPAAHAALIAAGADSGERVWPFPMDADFDEGLRSEVADVKQCAESGSGDHILAARFLSRFVPASIPWIHVDLSAAQRKGGLAHIPTECTGFGVRFTLDLLEHQLKLSSGFTDLFTR